MFIEGLVLSVDLGISRMSCNNERNEEDSKDDTVVDGSRCDICSKVYKHRPSLFRHMKTHQVPPLYVCIRCNRSYTRKDSLTKHIKKQKCTKSVKDKEWHCELCGRIYLVKSSYVRHQKSHCGIHLVEKVVTNNKENVNIGSAVKEKRSSKVPGLDAREEEDRIILGKETMVEIPVFTDSEDEIVMETPSKEDHVKEAAVIPGIPERL